MLSLEQPYTNITLVLLFLLSNFNMKTTKAIFKILLLYLVIFWGIGLFHHLVILGNNIESKLVFFEALFHPDVFYIYFIIVTFEILKFLSKKK
jgi:hypothetical protein